jgi:Atypical PilZ domain, cyclic di-GMP receptor
MPSSKAMDSTGVFNNALVIGGEFALRWQPGVIPDAAAAVRADADNMQLISAESSLTEAPAGDALKEESPQLAQELHRIELKLNILLKITGELLAHQYKFPPVRFARLSAMGVECAAIEPLPIGEQGTLDVFLNRSLPYALKFHAVVESERREGDMRFVQLRFLGLSDAVEDQLAKLIFRRHRRLVAVARQSP